MSFNDINPAVLVFITAVLLAAATLNYQYRQSQSGKVNKQRLEEAIALMQKAAVQTGDQETLHELINARTKLLETNRAPNDATINQVLAKVPQLTEDFKQLETNKATAADQLVTKYRANWEPVFRFAAEEFDKSVEMASKSYAVHETSKDDAFKVIGVADEGGNSQLVRVAEMNGVELRLYFGSAQVSQSHVENGSIALTVASQGKSSNESNPLNISFGIDHASISGRDFSASPESNNELARLFTTGLNNAIQDFLVRANARK